MEHVKKMLLVDPKVVENKSQDFKESKAERVLTKIENTLDRNTTLRNTIMTKLDQDINEVLENSAIPPDQKIKLYQQILQRYLHFRKEPEQNSSILTQKLSGEKIKDNKSSSDKPDYMREMKDEVIKGIPKKFQKNANILFKHIETNPDITYNDKGEFVFKGNVVQNSNIFDLINDLLRKKKHFDPAGWTVFSEAMQETNLPLTVVGNSNRLKHIKDQEKVGRVTKRRRHQNPIPWERLDL